MYFATLVRVIVAIHAFAELSAE